jgi:hypothetical protein
VKFFTEWLTELGKDDSRKDAQHAKVGDIFFAPLRLGAINS